MKNIQLSLPGARRRWQGHIDSVREGAVTGWAMDKAAPASPVDVEARTANGKTIVATADIYRDDLERAGLGDGRHGFRLDLSPWSVEDGEIDIAIVGSEHSLNAQPLSIAADAGPRGEDAEGEAREHGQGRAGEGAREDARGDVHGDAHGDVHGDARWRGYVDLFDRNVILGWAVDLEDPHRRVEVEAVSRTGRRVAAIAEGYRADVREHGYGDGRHAFELDIRGFAQADCPIDVVVDGGRHRLNPQPLDFDAMTMLARSEPPATLRALLGAAARAAFADPASEAPEAPEAARGTIDADGAVSRASAVLFETADPAADPEGLVSRFMQYEAFRCERERYELAMTGGLQDRLDAAMWYLVVYLRNRGYRFAPLLSAAQQRFLNAPAPLAGYPAEVTVALLNFVHAEKPEYADLRDPAILRAALYWWCCERAPRDKLDDGLTTKAMATFLMREEQFVGDAFPLTVFTSEYFNAHRELHALDMRKPVDRALFTVYLVTRSFTEPFIARLLPRDAMRMVLGTREGVVRYDEAIAHLLGPMGRDAAALRRRGEALLALRGVDLRRGAGFELRDRGEGLLRRRRYPAGVEPGVALIGPLQKTSGLGQAARLSLETMKRCEPVEPTVLQFDLDNPAPIGFASALASQPFARPREINLLHLNAESVPLAFAFEQQEIFAQSYNIGYFFWELNMIPKCHRLALELLDEIWVSSEYNREIYARFTDKPVINVGMAVEPLPRVEPMDRATFGLRDDATVFLTTFDSFSFIERKNPMGVLDAFRLAFPRGDEPVQLVLKTQNRGRVYDPYQMELWRRIDRVVGADPRVVIVNETLPYRDVLALKLACDCYVSLHRSEGWGFGMLEAMNLGRPVIATGFSGNMDFCTPETTYLVGHDLVGVREAEYIFVERGSAWAQPRVAEAAARLREVAADPAAARARGAAGSAHVAANFSIEAIARRYGARLAEIRAMRGPR